MYRVFNHILYFCVSSNISIDMVEPLAQKILILTHRCYIPCDRVCFYFSYSISTLQSHLRLRSAFWESLCVIELSNCWSRVPSRSEKSPSSPSHHDDNCRSTHVSIHSRTISRHQCPCSKSYLTITFAANPNSFFFQAYLKGT